MDGHGAFIPTGGSLPTSNAGVPTRSIAEPNACGPPVAVGHRPEQGMSTPALQPEDSRTRKARRKPYPRNRSRAADRGVHCDHDAGRERWD